MRVREGVREFREIREIRDYAKASLNSLDSLNSLNSLHFLDNAGIQKYTRVTFGEVRIFFCSVLHKSDLNNSAVVGTALRLNNARYHIGSIVPAVGVELAAIGRKVSI